MWQSLQLIDLSERAHVGNPVYGAEISEFPDIIVELCLWMGCEFISREEGNSSTRNIFLRKLGIGHPICLHPVFYSHLL